jgi:hypothetical protein
VSEFITRKEREREKKLERKRTLSSSLSSGARARAKTRSREEKEKEKEKREIQNGIELYLIRAVPNLLHELGQTSHAAEEPAVTATTTAGE